MGEMVLSSASLDGSIGFDQFPAMPSPELAKRMIARVSEPLGETAAKNDGWH
jgi:hypothetical protein